MQSQAPRLTVLTTTRSVSGSAWQALASKLPLTSRLQSSLVTSVHRWAVDSQRSACRNAMVAGTALAVRRAERRHGPVDDAKRESFRTRAYVTAALLCFIFAVVYTNTLFQTPTP